MADKKIDIARAWKDEDYRNTLTPEQLKELPANPAGETELSEDDLQDISGGVINNPCMTSNGGANRVNAPITTARFKA